MFIDDLRSVDLGDARCNKRVQRIAAQLATSPAATLPNLFVTPGELEGTYRLINRPKTTMEKIHAPHGAATVKRAAAHSRVLIIHDTTEFAFNDTGFEREHLSQLTSNRQGFYDHLSLAVSADGPYELLGVVSHLPYVHASQVDPAAAAVWRARGGLHENEHQRWLDAVIRCEAAFIGVPETMRVHVCDREGDSYELLKCLQDQRASYVVRCTQRHRTMRTADDKCMALEDVLARSPHGQSMRVISVPVEKQGETDSDRQRRKDVRPRRAAKVTVRWTEVTFGATAARTRRKNHTDEPLIYASVVEVTEVNPPEGLKPASWILYHSEAVMSEDAAWDVVDMYRTRWVIEEFFKVLKTGLAYETRQFMTAHSLLNMLAISSINACDIISLREAHRNRPEQLAIDQFDPHVVAYAKMKYPALVPSAKPTMAEFFAAVARAGGHIKQNGPPGWIVLYRGYAALLQGARVISDLNIDLATLGKEQGHS